MIGALTCLLSLEVERNRDRQTGNEGPKSSSLMFDNNPKSLVKILARMAASLVRSNSTSNSNRVHGYPVFIYIVLCCSQILASSAACRRA